MASRDTQVLIIGAGPTGLVLALWLAKSGVQVRIIDKASEPGTTSRAVAVQARTLELYSQLGLAQAVVEAGTKALAANLWVSGKRKARLFFGDMGAGISPYPNPLIFPQDEHERLLIGRLAELGVQVERQTELYDFEPGNGRVLARLKKPDGNQERCEAAYIAGCDGGHSTVRQKLKIGFPGGTYAHVFYVADVEGTGAQLNGELHAGLDAADFLAIFPMKGDGHARLVGTIRDVSEEARETLTWNDVRKGVIEWMQLDVKRVNWFSTYRVHHRVSERFREGRAFLLGDSAHVHSPVGGQGMNTGIGDAINLAWKLAAVLQARAHSSLLDTYEPERIAFARRLVKTTDQAFTAVTSSGGIARSLRLNLAPLIVPTLLRLSAFRRLAFRTVSQTGVNYRESPLSVGRAGPLRGGDRLPWVEPEAGTASDNFAVLTSLDWQVHIYGDASTEIRLLCEHRKLPLHIFAWRKEMERAGLQRDAVYVVRPDGYLGMADVHAAARTVSSYLDQRQIVSMRSSV